MVAPARATPAPLAVPPRGDFALQLLSMPRVDRMPFVLGSLRKILRDVLGLPDDVQLGAQRPFFEMGVSSVSLLQLRARLKTLIGQPIPAAALFEFPTLGSLAVYVVDRIHERSVRATEPQAEPREMPESGPPPAAGRSDDIAWDVAALSEDEATARLLREIAALEEP